MRSRLWLGALLLSACADPAAVRVQVEVQPPELNELEVRVQHEGKERVACRLPFEGAGEGLCPFEGGEGRWLRREQLSFVLHGTPGQTAELTVQGLREGRSVTSTAAQLRLPSEEGAIEVVDLVLPAASPVRRRCSLTLPPSSFEPERLAEEGDHSALLVLPAAEANPDGPQRLLVSAQNLLAEVELQSGPKGCALQAREILDSSIQELVTGTGRLVDRSHPRGWCNLRHGALAVRPARGRVGVTALAGLCVTGSSARLKIGLLTPEGLNLVGTATVAGAFSSVSDPVLADLDGDGQPEAFVFVRGPRGSGDLVRVWRDGARIRTETAPLFSTGAVAHDPPLPPLVLPAPTGGGPEAILALGNSEEGFVITGAGPRTLNLPASQRPPAAYMISDDEVGVVMQPGLSALLHVRLQRAQGIWSLASREIVNLSNVAPPSSQARITVGAWRTPQDLRALIMEDGVAQLVALDGTAEVQSLDVWNAEAADAQRTLWVNLDGVPGAELLSYGQAGARVAAWAPSGPALGWPVEFTGLSQRSVVAADLDAEVLPSGLRSLEIVSLSSRQLEVLSLGPGSYDALGMDWPSAAQSPHAAGVRRYGEDVARADLRP